MNLRKRVGGSRADAAAIRRPPGLVFIVVYGNDLKIQRGRGGGAGGGGARSRM